MHTCEALHNLCYILSTEEDTKLFAHPRMLVRAA